MCIARAVATYQEYLTEYMNSRHIKTVCPLQKHFPHNSHPVNCAAQIKPSSSPNVILTNSYSRDAYNGRYRIKETQNTHCLALLYLSRNPNAAHADMTLLPPSPSSHSGLLLLFFGRRERGCNKNRCVCSRALLHVNDMAGASEGIIIMHEDWNCLSCMFLVR